MTLFRMLCLAVMICITGAAAAQEEEMIAILGNKSLTYDQKLDAYYELLKKHSPEMALMLDEPASKQILEQQFKQMAAYYSFGQAMESSSAGEENRNPSPPAQQKTRVDTEAQRQAMLKEREGAQQEMLRRREEAEKADQQQQFASYLQSIPEFPGELDVKSAFDIKDVRPGEALHASVEKLFKDGFTDLAKMNDQFRLRKHTELDSSRRLEEEITLKLDDQAPGTVLEMYYSLTVRTGRMGPATLYPGLDFGMLQKSLIDKFGAPLTAETAGLVEHNFAAAAEARSRILKQSRQLKFLGLDCNEEAQKVADEAASFLEKRKASVLKKECKAEQKQYGSKERALVAKADAAFEQSLKSTEFKKLDICGFLGISTCPGGLKNEGGFVDDNGYVYTSNGKCNIWVKAGEILRLCKSGRDELSTRIEIRPQKVKAAWQVAITQTKEIAPAVEVSL